VRDIASASAAGSDRAIEASAGRDLAVVPGVAPVLGRMLAFLDAAF
jgi:hypothetical protein